MSNPRFWLLFTATTLLFGLAAAPHLQKVKAACDRPSGCSVWRSCPHVISPLPCFYENDGNDEISGMEYTISTAYSDGIPSPLIYDVITIDNSGAFHADGGIDNLYFRAPQGVYDGDSFVTGVWWRMHDHERSVEYILYGCAASDDDRNNDNVCRDSAGNNRWQALQSGGVHTSGEGCVESCSTNHESNHPPGNQGCPDPMPDPRYCTAASQRENWPCAQSFDEVSWNNNCQNLPFTKFRLMLTASGDHVHIADFAFIIRGKPQCDYLSVKVNNGPESTDPGELITVSPGDTLTLTPYGVIPSSSSRGLNTILWRYTDQSTNYCSASVWDVLGTGATSDGRTPLTVSTTGWPNGTYWLLASVYDKFGYKCYSNPAGTCDIANSYPCTCRRRVQVANPGNLRIYALGLDNIPSTCDDIKDNGTNLDGRGLQAHVAGGRINADYSLNVTTALNSVSVGDYDISPVASSVNQSPYDLVQGSYYYCIGNEASAHHFTTSPFEATVSSNTTTRVYIGFIKRQPVRLEVFEKPTTTCSLTGATEISGDEKLSDTSFSCNGGPAATYNSAGYYECRHPSNSSIYFDPNTTVSFTYTNLPTNIRALCWLPAPNLPSLTVPYGTYGLKQLLVNQNRPAWWQTRYGDIFSTQISNPIPPSCQSPGCYPFASLEGAKASPTNSNSAGVVTATSTLSLGGGSASDDDTGYGWLTNSGYSPPPLSYATLEQKVTGRINTLTNVNPTTHTISAADLQNLINAIPAPTDQTSYYRHTGDLIIDTGTVNVGSKKFTLFITGTLTLKAAIKLDDGIGFAGFIAAQNIRIDSNLSGTSTEPALEGIYFAESTVETLSRSPTADSQLWIKGSLVGLEAVKFGRDLDPYQTTGDNNTAPAEIIISDPTLHFTFPNELKYRGLVWEQIAD